MSANSNRIAIGTAQFGLPYGITNDAGQVTREEATGIINYASSVDLDTLDTAIAYGDSEQRLGEIGVARWRIVSKLQMPARRPERVEVWVRTAVSSSLARLRVKKLYGLLLHHSPDLLSDDGSRIYFALRTLQDEGLVEKIGVSIYSPDELERLDGLYDLDLVQAPFNILDRRLVTSNWLARLNDRGTEIHARSLFLQGLLLADRDHRPGKFNRWQALWDQWDHWLSGSGLTRLEGCLSFVLSHPEVERLIVGVESVRQLEDIVASTNIRVEKFPNLLASNDLDLINPSNWNKL